jgi:hypothetical protein
MINNKIKPCICLVYLNNIKISKIPLYQVSNDISKTEIISYVTKLTHFKKCLFTTNFYSNI